MQAGAKAKILGALITFLLSLSLDKHGIGTICLLWTRFHESWCDKNGASFKIQFVMGSPALGSPVESGFVDLAITVVSLHLDLQIVIDGLCLQ